MLHHGLRNLSVGACRVVSILRSNPFICLPDCRKSVQTSLDLPLGEGGKGESEVGELDPVDGLICLGEGVVRSPAGLDCRSEILHRSSIFLLTLLAGVHPLVESGFLLLCAADDVQLVEGKLHSLPLLPAVR